MKIHNPGPSLISLNIRIQDFVVATDPEAAQNVINIYIKRDGTPADKKDAAYLREQYISDLFNSMTGARITELLQKGQPPFIMGVINNGGFLRGYNAISIAAITSPEKESTALAAIYTEVERILRHGFMPGEFQRAKSNLLTSMKSAYDQRDKISNDTYIRGMQAHFLSGEPLTSAEMDWQIGQALLQSITVDDVNAASKKWITKDNRVILIMGPENAEHIDEEETLKILAEVEKSEIEPYEDVEIASSLISEELPAGSIVATRELEEFGATEWTLSNNAKVVFRHADYEKDNVALRAYSLGGISTVSTDELASGMMLPQFIGMFGTGDFDAIALRNALTGKKVNVSVGFNNLTETISGSSTPKDFESMMQLVYLNFAKPRFDIEAYNAMYGRLEAFLPNLENDPQKTMQDSLELIYSNFHPRTKLFNAELLNEVSFDDMEKIYRDRIFDAGDFTFFIVGNIDKEVAKEFAVKYIGALEDAPRNESWTDRNVNMPEGITERKIEIPFETEKANVVVTYRNDFEYSARTNIYLNILKAVLDLRYTEEIREKEGGTYGVGISTSNGHFPDEEKTLRMSFDTDPEKADYLKSIVFRELEKISKEGPTQEDLDKVTTNMKKNREQSKEHNSYWMNTIYNYYYNGINNDLPDNFEDIVENVTPKDIKKFTAKFIKGADIIDIIFVPKK